MTEELKKLEEALPMLKECDVEKASRMYKEKRNERRNCRTLGESGAEWQMAATSLHSDVFLNSEECYECEADCAYADVDTWVGSLEIT